MSLLKNALNSDDFSESHKVLTPETEWQNMPEFIQEKKEAFSKIIIRFNSQEDLDEFSEMIGQKLTNRTKSIWHPKLNRSLNSDMRYIDEPA